MKSSVRACESLDLPKDTMRGGAAKELSDRQGGLFNCRSLRFLFGEGTGAGFDYSRDSDSSHVRRAGGYEVPIRVLEGMHSGRNRERDDAFVHSDGQMEEAGIAADNDS